MLSTLILNKLRGNLKVCCVKCPGFGNNRKNQLDDIGVLTNGQVLDPELGMSFDSVDMDILGSSKKMIIGKDDSIIIDGAGDKKDIQARVDQILGEIESSTSEYDKEKL